MGTGDLKLMNRSLKELRYARKIFAPYRTAKGGRFRFRRGRRRGSGRAACGGFGRQMVVHHYMVHHRRWDGSWAGAARAGRETVFGLNIRLPFEQRANQIIHGDPKLINFTIFHPQVELREGNHAFAFFPVASGRWMKDSKR